LSQQLFELFRTDPEYARLFPAAFPADADPFTLGTMTRALASFQRTLISYDSPYDRYRYGRDPTAISEAAKRGEALFFSEDFECHHCHGGLNLTDSIHHQRLAFAETAFPTRRCTTWTARAPTHPRTPASGKSPVTLSAWAGSGPPPSATSR
jgi:cytochrome c peroxidase